MRDDVTVYIDKTGKLRLAHYYIHFVLRTIFSCFPQYSKWPIFVKQFTIIMFLTFVPKAQIFLGRVIYGLQQFFSQTRSYAFSFFFEKKKATNYKWDSQH